MTLREVSRSVRWPKLFQPSPTAETRRPEPPRLRISINQSCVLRVRKTRYCDLMALARKARAHSVFERSMPSDLIRGWKPVRAKKTRQDQKRELGSDSIKTG